MTETTIDIESHGKQDDYLTNHVLDSLSWENLHVNIPFARPSDHMILFGIDGMVSAGNADSVFSKYATKT